LSAKVRKVFGKVEEKNVIFTKNKKLKMKLRLLLILFLLTLASFGQDYPFLPKDFIKLNKESYLDFLNTHSKIKINSYLENGKVYTQKTQDSINKDKTFYRFKQLFYADTIKIEAAIVYKKMTDAEIKERNSKFAETRENDSKNRNELKGSTLNHLDLTDINGTKYTLESLKGKIVVFNFWFIKCGACIQEIPDLNQLKQTFSSDDVVFFSITFDKNNLVEEFLKKTRMDYTVIPNDKKTIDQFKIQFFPTNLIIDKEGKVVFINELFKGNGIKQMHRILLKLTKN